GTAEDGQAVHDIYYPLGAAPVTFNWPSSLGNEKVAGLSGVENATGALLEFTSYSVDSTVITYSLNGNPSHTFAYPGCATAAHGGQTDEPYAIPISLSEIHDGSNRVTFSSNNSVDIGNIDLILLGAGGGGSPSTP